MRLPFGRQPSPECTKEVGYAVAWTARPAARGPPGAAAPDSAILLVGGEYMRKRARDMGIACVELPGDRDCLKWVLKGHGGPVYAMRPHPSHPGLVFSASADGSARLWDVLGRACLARFSDAFAHPVNVLHLDAHVEAAAGGGRRLHLATADVTGTVRVYTWVEGGGGGQPGPSAAAAGARGSSSSGSARPGSAGGSGGSGGSGGASSGSAWPAGREAGSAAGGPSRFFERLDVPEAPQLAAAVAAAAALPHRHAGPTAPLPAIGRGPGAPPSRPSLPPAVLVPAPGYSTQRPHGNVVDSVAFVPLRPGEGIPCLLSKQANPYPGFGRLWRPSNPHAKTPFGGPYGADRRPSSIRTVHEFRFGEGAGDGSGELDGSRLFEPEPDAHSSSGEDAASEGSGAARSPRRGSPHRQRQAASPASPEAGPSVRWSDMTESWWSRLAVHPSRRYFAVGASRRVTRTRRRPNGELVEAKEDEGHRYLYVFDVAAGRPLQRVQVRHAGTHPAVVRACSFSPDGRFLACCTNDGHVHLLEDQNWSVAGPGAGRPERPQAPASPGSASGEDDASVVVCVSGDEADVPSPDGPPPDPIALDEQPPPEGAPSPPARPASAALLASDDDDCVIVAPPPRRRRGGGGGGRRR